MKYILTLLTLFICQILVFAQAKKETKTLDKHITHKEVARILSHLSSDAMEGRGTFTAGIDRAAAYISEEFKKNGLQPLTGDSYLQPFTLKDLKVPQRFGGMNPDQNAPLANVVGIIPGKSKPEEYVIFSGHYDHLGTAGHLEGDTIFNGANDDASGITAVILLAKYFAKLDNNARTLVFAAFTAEEIGGFGSRYFSQHFDSSKVMAMFNIEMIGTDSKWGLNAAYITGYEKTNMGEILEQNLRGTNFKFYPDPYPAQQLFYRSDNATLAQLGVPAHTISTSKMDVEPHYHAVTDEIGTLDLKNMTQIIKAIALSSKTIVDGKDTPSRVKKEQLR